jgi:hypothetical protein
VQGDPEQRDHRDRHAELIGAENEERVGGIAQGKERDGDHHLGE